MPKSKQRGRPVSRTPYLVDVSRVRLTYGILRRSSVDNSGEFARMLAEHICSRRSYLARIAVWPEPIRIEDTKQRV